MKSLKLTGSILLVLTLAVFFTANAVQANTEELTKVRYFPAWYWHWEDVAVPVGIETGIFKDHGIKIMDPKTSAGGPGMKSPIRRMLAAPGIAFCTHYNWYALKGRVDRGWPIKVLANSFQDPALRLVTWFPIEKKSDLYGKTIEVWDDYQYPLETYLGKEHMGKKPSDDKAKVTRSQITMSKFKAHQVDGSHAMIYNELLELKEHYGIDKIIPSKNQYTTNTGGTIYVYSYSELNSRLAWDENSIMTKTETLKKYPDAIDRFLKAYYQSWLKVISMDPEKVMEILVKYNPDLKKYWEREKLGGLRVNELLLNDNTCKYGLGYIDPSTWPDMAQALFEAGLLENKPTEAQIWSTYEYRPIEAFPPEEFCNK